MVELKLKVFHGNTLLAYLSHSSKSNRIGLIGPTASGKSIVLKAIVSLINNEKFRSVKGSIIIGKKKFEDGITNKNKFQAAYIPQDSIRGFVAPTVESSIKLSIICGSINSNNPDEIYQNWKATSPLSHFYTRSPLTLSTGEKRLLLLECAILRFPELICIDGGLSTLSPNFRYYAIHLIDKWMNNNKKILIWAETNKNLLAEIVNDFIHLSSVNKLNSSSFQNVDEGTNISTHANKTSSKKKKILEYRNVTGGYKKNNKFIIQNVNLSINSGEIYGIIGENGVGKSTLVNMVSGSIEIKSGSIDYLGNSIYDSSYPGIDNGIAYLPEELDVAGAISHLDKFNNSGFKDDFTESQLDYWELSSGEQVEKYIEWLIEHKPKLLILDEPTSRIQSNEVFKILSIIRNKNPELAIILATHDRILLKKLSAIVYRLSENGLKKHKL